MIDSVCIVSFIPTTPMILRPGKLQDTYIIIGPAFVYGIMYDEADAISLRARELTLV
jgi:hypothetical protein